MNKKTYIDIRLKGAAANINAIGRKSYLCLHRDSIRTYENYPVHGFLSSMQASAAHWLAAPSSR